MKVLKYILLSCSVALAIPAQARVEKICINNIHKILTEYQNLKLKGNTIAIFDWDQTISKDEGQEIPPREEGEKGTKETLEALKNSDVKTMILSARGEGMCPSAISSKEEMIEMFDSVAKSMVESDSVPEKWVQNGPLIGDITEIVDLKNSLCAVNVPARQVVFSKRKGETLAKFIDEEKIVKPDNILFIDNDYKNVEEFGNAFKNREENVYIFYYPKKECEQHDKVWNKVN